MSYNSVSWKPSQPAYQTWLLPLVLCQCLCAGESQLGFSTTEHGIMADIGTHKWQTEKSSL